MSQNQREFDAVFASGELTKITRYRDLGVVGVKALIAITPKQCCYAQCGERRSYCFQS